MRETRQSGSEGGGGGASPYPYPPRSVVACNYVFHASGATAMAGTSPAMTG